MSTTNIETMTRGQIELVHDLATGAAAEVDRAGRHAEHTGFDELAACVAGFLDQAGEITVALLDVVLLLAAVLCLI